MTTKKHLNSKGEGDFKDSVEEKSASQTVNTENKVHHAIVALKPEKKNETNTAIH